MRSLSLATIVAIVALSGCGDASLVGPMGDGGRLDALMLDRPTDDQSCATGQRTCDGRCVDPSGDPAHCGACGIACAAGQRCVAGACVLSCPGVEAMCAGECRNLLTDTASCGACGRACPSGQVCSLGRCATTCAATLTTCTASGGATACVDVRSDRSHCGACGNACATGQTCVDGACALACPGAQRDCGGTCRDLQGDDAHCGACGNACPAGNVCAAGVCVASCAAGLTPCGDACVNLQTDGANCGACARACGADQVCGAGVCAASCVAPAMTCASGTSRRCADTAIDPAHCGGCDRACALPHTQTQGCTRGSCAVVRCAGGYGDCDGDAANGCETETSSSAMHCGGCGLACQLPHASATCAAGACAVRACDPGFADCDRAPSNGCEVDTRTNAANCGACGASCAAGQVCSGGVCGATCGAPFTTCGEGATTWCASTANDPTSCGACGRVCALEHVATQGCSAGACVPARCAAGFADCDENPVNGCEVSLLGSATDCGACGRACALPNATARCAVGACRVAACAAGFADCDGNPSNGCEVNTRTDNTSCGACGRACAAGQVCSAGTCGATCASPLRTCGMGSSAFCANTANDPSHCGACAAACALPGAMANGCAMGACTVVRCNQGAGDCNGTAGDGCETNLQTSEAHCGACGRACALPHASASCVGGACAVASCAMGYADCDRDPGNGCEVNTGTDNAHCGGCGTACAAGQLCSGGTCGATCASPLRTCGSGASALCANTAVDPANCGDCGAACALPNATAQSCAMGACTVVRCAGGYGDCDGDARNGCETDVRASATSCGVCGRACVLPNATAQCAAGACGVSACAAGFADCDGDPSNGCEVDARTDNAHCGACGAACAAGQVCSGGACGATCASPLRTCGMGSTAFCANTAIDPNHCGGCGQTCALTGVATHGCAASACTVVRCVGGAGDCDGDASNGCETDLNASATSCGACGRACALANATSACSAGACAVAACRAGFADCNMNPADGCEVDTRSDATSCGACGVTCTAGQVCSGGVCATTCASPLRTCGTGSATFCANTTNNPAHCGACGAGCALANVSTPGCASGACTVVGCATGYGDCDGAPDNGCETNLQTSASSCGACQRPCALPNAIAACTGGACALVGCAAGFADCNANAADGCEVNTRTDNASCGACGRACAAGQVCSGGACGTTCGSPLRACGSGVDAFCANTAVDPAHCGACDAACALPRVAVSGCAAGACTVTRCVGGHGDCDGVATNGCEVDLNASASDCGGCGRRCALPHATAACAAGACAVAGCATGFLDCDGNAANGCEVDVGSDNANCGACGVACAPGRVCSGGACGATCASPLRACGSGMSAFCANPLIDPANCGACGAACALPSVVTNGCAAGACTVVRCAVGTGDCDRNANNGCETNTLTNAAHCGACGRGCALPNATASCASGVCAITACASGFLDCDRSAANGCEVDARSDNANCGGCGMTCASGRVCSGGTCGATCASPLRTCGSGEAAFCANTSVDPSNCGACGAACALSNVATHGCASGACTVLRCAGGAGDCDGNAANGCEISTRTNIAHCGACGRACVLPNASASCASGACAIAACTTGFLDCDRDPGNGCEVDIRSDNANCGGCGVSCAAGRVCAGGACGATCQSTQVNCSGTCATLASDPRHCGACDRACATPANASAAYCAASTCGFVCTAGFGNCDNNAGNGCEVDTRSSTAHCGACGRACGSGQSCASGSCTCPPGQRAVGTLCVAAGVTPRPLAPLSLGDVTQRRPTLRWALPTGYDGTQVELCRDRACSMVIETLTVAGRSARPTADLPAGSVVYWRLRGLVGSAVDSADSPTWLFHVPLRSASSPIDTSGNAHLDMNGDGLDDVAVGAPNAGSGGRGRVGAVSVSYGSASWTPSAPGVPHAVDRRYEAPLGGHTFGCAVASAGDVNGDGYGDLLVGAYSASVANVGSGAAYVFYGGPSWSQPALGVPSVPDRRVEGAAEGDRFGHSVGGAGDVNGDGYADLVVGSLLASPGGRMWAGSASVFYGSSAWVQPPEGGARVPDRRMEGVADHDRFSGSVAGVGDVNGDGYSDIAVGSNQASPGGRQNTGSAIVFYGSATWTQPPSGTPRSPDRSLEGRFTSDQFGFSVAGAGDVNGDGFFDVVVGAPAARVIGVTAGTASVFYGSLTWTQPTTGTAPIADRVYEGSPDGVGLYHEFGRAVAGARDVNGDGYADVIVGAAYAALPSNLGSASVFYGGAAWTQPAEGSARTPNVLYQGVATGNYFSISVAGAGDVNGDGFADLIVGAHFADPGTRTNAGTASVFYGGASLPPGMLGAPSVADRLFEGAAQDDQLGFAVAR